MQPLTLDSLLPHLWISGRASRREWWRVHMACAAIMFVFDQMFHARIEQGAGGLGNQAVTLLWLAVTAVLSWISWTGVVRRLHDRGKSGWWSLLYLVPGIGWLWLIIECGFLPGRAPAVAAAPQVAPHAAPQAAPRRAPRPAMRETAPASRTARAATPRVGTVQRAEYRPWTTHRVMRLTGNAVGLALLALVLYQVFFDTHMDPLFGSALNPPATFESVK